MDDFSDLINEIKSQAPYELDKIKMYMNLLGPAQWENIDKYFIVSTGRTGTKFLARFFQEFSDVYAVHEPTPDFLDLAIDYARELVDKKTAVDKIEFNRRALGRDVNRKGSKVYVESNNRYFSLLNPLEEVFDNFKIIHIVRDGRDYVRSGISRVWYTKDDSDPRMKATYFPEDPYYNQWEQMSRFEKICWRWQKKDGFIYNKVKKLDNAITVKFEDIFKNKNYRGIYKIANYLKLPERETEQIIDSLMNKKVNSTKDYEISKWTEWSSQRKEKFDEIAGEHMKNYYNYKW